MNKHYNVRFEKDAQKSLNKMDRNNSKIIMAWISKNLVQCTNPYMQGMALQGNLKDKWRYGVGNYRLICSIDNENIVILVLVIGHKKDIYK